MSISLDDLIASRDVSKFVEVILDSFQGDSNAGADFLREAVKRIALTSQEEEPEDDGYEADERHYGRRQRPSEEDSGDEAQGNTKRVAELDLDGPRAKAARTATGLKPNIGSNDPDQSFFAEDATDDQPFSLVLLVPDTPAIIADIIGKGGQNIAETQRMSGASVQIDKNASRGRERKVAITGAVRKIMLAYQVVVRRVSEKEEELSNAGTTGGGINVMWRDQSGVFKTKLLVPNNTVRHLIGKSGAVVTQLEKESGAQLKFQHESEMDPVALGRMLEFQGPPENQTAAVYQVLRRLAEERTLPPHWRGGDVFAAQNQLLHSASPYPRAPSNSLYVPSPSAGPMGAASAGPVYSNDYGSSMRGQPPPRQGMANGSLGSMNQSMAYSPYSAYPSQQIEPSYPMQAPAAPQVRPPPFQTRPSTAYAASAQPAPTYSAAPATQASYDPMGASGANMNMADYTTVTVAVPDASVRFLIGKQGSAVTDLERQSGCRVEFAKSAEPSHPNERYVSIRGTGEAVRIGTGILQTRVSEWQGSTTLSR